MNISSHWNLVDCSRAQIYHFFHENEETPQVVRWILRSTLILRFLGVVFFSFGIPTPLKQLCKIQSWLYSIWTKFSVLRVFKLAALQTNQRSQFLAPVEPFVQKTQQRQFMKPQGVFFFCFCHVLCSFFFVLLSLNCVVCLSSHNLTCVTT